MVNARAIKSPRRPLPCSAKTPRMTIQSPRVVPDLVAAHAASLRDGERVFVPASIYADDRGWSIMNQFQGVLGAQGQINYSVMYPGAIKAWHRHKLQTDFWMCVQG